MNVPDPTAAAPVTTPVIAPAIPWWKSPQQLSQLSAEVGAACVAFPHVAAQLGLIDAATINAKVTAVAAVWGLLSGAAALVLRAISKIQPLTWSAKSAAAHVNTLATAVTQAKMADAGIPTAAQAKVQIAAVQAAKAANDAAINSIK
jgi:hypothetical protein